MSEGKDSAKKQPPSGTPKVDEGKTGSDQNKKLPAPDSKKIDLTYGHRMMMADGPGIPWRPFMFKSDLTALSAEFYDIPPHFQRTVPPSLKPVYVNEMDEYEDCVYVNRILRLTLIEDPLTGWVVATNLLGQDEKGSTTRVFIYNIPQDDEFRALLAFGTKLGIINPYHRVAMDGKDGIRVDDPTEVVYLGRVEKMCRYCGQKDAQRSCANCKVSYCDRACQLADWKMLKHKVICKSKLGLPFAYGNVTQIN